MHGIQFRSSFKSTLYIFWENYQTKQQPVSNNGNDGKTIFEKILINWMFFEVAEFKFKVMKDWGLLKSVFLAATKI